MFADSFRGFLQVCADDVASVIGDILLRCREDGSPVRLCKPKQTGEVGIAPLFGSRGWKWEDNICDDLMLHRWAL